MNFPSKKTHIRFLCLTLVLTLIAGTFSGCLGGGKDPTEPQGEPPLNLVESKPTESTEPSTAPEDPTEETTDEEIAYVKVQTNVLQIPSSKANVIGYLDPGDQVTVMQREPVNGVEWALLREGWVPAENLTTEKPSDTDPDATEPPEETKPEEDDDKTTTGTKGTITASELNIRKEASGTAAKVGAYKKGDTVTILETKNGWGRTDKGWISMQYVKTGTTTNNNTTATGTKGTVTASELNIRKEASGTSTKVGSYKKGDTVTILETKNGWGRTDKGWISMQYVNTGDKTNNQTETGTGTATNIKAVVTANELNIRSQASTNGERKGAYTYGDRITILETKDGWGRTDKGWVSLTYVYQDGTTGKGACKGLVTGDTLNVRSGPGAGYDKVDSLKSMDRVNVLHTIKIGNDTWGCIKGGWISMAYVYVDGTTAEGAGTGTVTGDQVNIRTGPGTTYGSAGSLNSGDKIKIYAQFKVGDMTWGCTDKGWVSMKYVDFADKEG